MTDGARPRFWVASGTRDAADRWLARHGWPQANWTLRERTVARRLAGRWNVSPREAREIEAWRRSYHAPDPAMVAAVTFLRSHRRRARWAVRLRLTRFEVAMYGTAWAVAMLAWTA